MSDSEQVLSCKLNSSCDCIHVLSSMVELAGHRAGLSDKQINRMVLAVDEMFANIARHGYQGREGRVDISARWQHGELCFELRDYAKPVDNAQIRDWLTESAEVVEAGRRPGGLGMQLMRAVMDRVEHESLADGNRWLLVKFLDTKDGMKDGEQEA